MRGFGASYYAYAGDVAVLHIGSLTQDGKEPAVVGICGSFQFQ